MFTVAATESHPRYPSPNLEGGNICNALPPNYGAGAQGGIIFFLSDIIAIRIHVLTNSNEAELLKPISLPLLLMVNHASCSWWQCPLATLVTYSLLPTP